MCCEIFSRDLLWNICVEVIFRATRNSKFKSIIRRRWRRTLNEEFLNKLFELFGKSPCIMIIVLKISQLYHSSEFFYFLSPGISSSGSFSVCHWAIGLRGDASMSDQCLNSVPEALYPRTTFPIGSDVPIRS